MEWVEWEGVRGMLWSPGEVGSFDVAAAVELHGGGGFFKDGGNESGDETAEE